MTYYCDEQCFTECVYKIYMLFVQHCMLFFNMYVYCIVLNVAQSGVCCILYNAMHSECCAWHIICTIMYIVLYTLCVIQ